MPEMPSMRLIVEATKALSVAILVLVLGYAAAGLAGGAIPRNAGWRAPRDGVAIWVESNGVHVGLIVPKLAAGVDWRPLAPPHDLRDPRFAGYDHLAIGWGEQAFFLGTPTWADVRPGTILAAAIGSDATLMHVEHVPAPAATDATVRRIILRPAEYRRLARAMMASFVPGGRRYPGYGDGDLFYEGRGHYDALRTCNAWTGSVLRGAGVRVGAWTPFPVTVTGWF